MPHFRTISYCLLLTLCIASPAQSQELGLKLKPQPELIPYSAREDEPTPLFIEADRVQGHTQRELEAEGNVRLRKRGAAVFADYLRYSFPDQQLGATGNLRFDFEGNSIEGESLHFDLERFTGSIERPRYFIRELNAHGDAEQMDVQSRDRLRVRKATYTNCEVGDDDWYLRVDRLDLDRTRDIGVARNASVVFKGVPFLYSPYLDFSLSGSRKSGLLPPSIGQTAQSGFETTLPFYWNIAPNRDMTIAPRVLSRRGVLMNTELRYLEPGYSGELRGEYLPDDRIRDESRYGYSVQHRHDFGYGFSGGLNLQGVSDDDYFTDLSDKIAVTSLTNLPREGNLGFDGEWWNFNARVQKFQTLQDPLAPVVPPYERLPQLSLLANRQTPLGLDVGAKGEYVEFSHPTLLNGRRETLYPSLSLPLQTAFFYITPKAGFHYTRYTFDDAVGSRQTRQMPIYSVDSAITFERDTDFFGRSYIQTLEPRLYYVYIPFRPQDQLPNFDTAVADFSLAQIFTENQFTGGDRINDADQVTAAVTSRLINPDDGSEQIRFTLGQRYFFSEQRVTLDPAVSPRTSDRSDLLAAVSGAITPSWITELGLQYSTVDNQTERSNFALRYRPEAGKVLNFGYRFTREALEQLDLSTQWRLTSKWTGLARWNYSLRDSRMLEGLTGLEYNAGCWGARFVAHRFVSSTQDYVTSFFLQLELTGLSRIGPNPLETLRQNITGYTETTEPQPSGRSPFPAY
ncbi:MAG: LPS-assembly protein LptD [Burkholderiales bacterium]